MSRIVLAMLAMAVAAAAWSAEWSFAPSLDARLRHDDNIALTPNTKDSVWSAQAAPRARFTWREALTEMALDTRLALNRHPGHAALNTTDFLADLSAATESERNRYGVSARWERDSTLATEVRETGVVQARRQRARKSIAPNYRRALTERTSAALRYQFTDVAYERASGLRDYRIHQAGASHIWQVSERLRADTSVDWEDLRTQDRGVLTTTRSLSQGLSYGITPRITLDGSVGWRRSRTTVNSLICPLGAQVLCDFFQVAPVALTNSVKETGLVYGLTARMNSETGYYDLSVSRGTSPTGNGLTVRTDRLGVQWRADWSERISLGAGASWLRSQYDGNLAAGSKYVNFDTSVNWRLGERWSLSAQYAFARSRVDNVLGSARSNALFITLSYQWLPVSMK